MAVLRHLRAAIDFKASELAKVDLIAGVLAGIAGAILGIHRPGLLQDSVGTAATLVTAIIGAVLAGVAIQAAFMDRSFLRSLRRINGDPVRYLAPFIFTAALGVLAALALLVLGFTTATAPAAWRGSITGLAGFLTVYTLVSLLPALDTLVQFIGLKTDAASLPEAPEDSTVRRLHR